VVAIGAVGLALGLEAKEHRALGTEAADHRAADAAAAGGLAIARARLELALRQVPRSNGSSAGRLRGFDPWLDADSLFPDTLTIGRYAVRLHGEDLQARLLINAVQVTKLRAFLSFLLQDFGNADALAQAITDWRDNDDLAQPRGAEREDYLRRRRLDLPGNRGGFRDLEELRLVEGMTPEILAKIRPYLRVQGQSSTINVNTAAPPVLRAIPGMTDAIITRIMAIRSQRQRITSLADIGVPGPLQQRMDGQVSFDVTQLELTVTVAALPPAHPVQSVWTLERANNGAEVRWTDFSK
jgi:hypothetical protein